MCRPSFPLAPPIARSLAVHNGAGAQSPLASLTPPFHVLQVGDSPLSAGHCRHQGGRHGHPHSPLSLPTPSQQGHQSTPCSRWLISESQPSAQPTDSTSSLFLGEGVGEGKRSFPHTNLLKCQEGGKVCSFLHLTSLESYRLCLWQFWVGGRCSALSIPEAVGQQ